MLAILFLVLYVAAYVYLRIYIYEPSANKVSYKNNNFYVFGLNIPAHLDFCGEKIPSNDMGIKKDLEKEFFNDTYWKAHSTILFNRAQRWFPVIEPILKEEGVPNDFKYLAVIESHLSNVTSPAGASGFWQLVPSSAYGYGLEVSSSIDERYNVEKATHAACAHIKDAYAVFKNWTLAAAAYNRGIGGIQNALKTQNTDNYYDLMLNSETGSFVYRLLAFKTLLSSPSHFGIKNRLGKRGQKINFKSFKFDSSITSLSHFAKHIGTTVKTIKAFNPWILGNDILNPAKKKYEIKIPKNSKADYSAYMADLSHELITEEADAASSLSTAAVTDTSHVPEKVIYYAVKVDEPLSNLATFFKISVDDLKKWNNLGDNTNAVRGQTLTIYYNKK
ncbi:MAG: transglycosylase SLT domain-containing protein [Bacteroidia bacterium]|nr:transglycosylase SLT domain-containing protein [Bacteroidia bacterium]